MILPFCQMILSRKKMRLKDSISGVIEKHEIHLGNNGISSDLR